MGCATSFAAERRETYSPTSHKYPRQNQVVPAQAPQSRATLDTTRSERQRSVHNECVAATARQGKGGTVIQSALKLQTDGRVNQYKFVSSKPIGKGFQSKVC